MKTCKKCKIHKEDAEFYIRYTQIGTGYLDTNCKQCYCKAAAQRRTKPGYKETRKAWDLKHYYNITLEQYNQMSIDQNHKCKICNKPETQNPKGSNALAVDHCHTTGKVRGLLCSRCNLLLGKAEDSIPVLEEAINYLRTAK